VKGETHEKRCEQCGKERAIRWSNIIFIFQIPYPLSFQRLYAGERGQEVSAFCNSLHQQPFQISEKEVARFVKKFRAFGIPNIDPFQSRFICTERVQKMNNQLSNCREKVPHRGI
jgi:hypothetical protein